VRQAALSYLVIHMSLRESLSLPCKQIGWQRVLFARQRLHGKGHTAMSGSATPSLPCASPKLHGKGFPMCRVFCRAPRPSAVRAVFVMCLTALPYGRAFAGSCTSAVILFSTVRRLARQRLAPPIHPHGKAPARHTTGLPRAQASATCPLCRL
jgi:hypothetical protein